MKYIYIYILFCIQHISTHLFMHVEYLSLITCYRITREKIVLAKKYFFDRNFQNIIFKRKKNNKTKKILNWVFVNPIFLQF